MWHRPQPMMRRRHAAICTVAGAVLGVFAVAQAAGLRINATPSMPVGLWMVTATTLSPGRGEIVAVCLPDSDPAREAFHRGYTGAGSCPGGPEPLVKPIAAIGGDVVDGSAVGIAVNGTPISNPASLSRDEAGRPLQRVPAGLYRVPSGELWLLSGHDPRSFDSRYFGAVPITGVRGIASPVWVLQ